MTEERVGGKLTKFVDCCEAAEKEADGNKEEGICEAKG